MLGFPRTFSSGMGFQKKLRTRRFFLPLEVEVAGGGGGGSGGGAPGGGGGRGGGTGGGAESPSGTAGVCPDMEAVVMEEEEALQLLPSLLQLSGSWVVDGQLITSIPGRGGQRRCTADLRGKTDQSRASPSGKTGSEARVDALLHSFIQTAHHPTATPGRVSPRQ